MAKLSQRCATTGARADQEARAPSAPSCAKVCRTRTLSLEDKFAAQRGFAKLARNSCIDAPQAPLPRDRPLARRTTGSSASRASRCARWRCAASCPACARRAGRRRSEGRHPPRLPQGALRRHRHGPGVGLALDAHVRGEAHRRRRGSAGDQARDLRRRAIRSGRASQRELDTEGRVDRFRKRYGQKKK